MVGEVFATTQCLLNPVINGYCSNAFLLQNLQMHYFVYSPLLEILQFSICMKSCLINVVSPINLFVLLLEIKITPLRNQANI